MLPEESANLSSYFFNLSRCFFKFSTTFFQKHEGEIRIKADFSFIFMQNLNNFSVFTSLLFSRTTKFDTSHVNNLPFFLTNRQPLSLYAFF